MPKEFLLPLGDVTLRTGFMATDHGATVAGQPDVAAGWFPVNDHPRDKAAYDFHVTVPEGLGVVANGFLTGTTTQGGKTRFDWHAPEPMASYLATIDIGKWDVRQGQTASGLPIYDAVDPDLLSDPVLGPSINASLARQARSSTSFRRRSVTTPSPQSGRSSTTSPTSCSRSRRRRDRSTRSTSGPTAGTV